MYCVTEEIAQRPGNCASFFDQTVDNRDINVDNRDTRNRTPEAKKYGEPADTAELVMNAAKL